MKINIIAAIGKNNEIGLNNQLLWKSKSDLEHFKQLTLGKPVIMGRKTFESLPGILPRRTHIVVTNKRYLPGPDHSSVHIVGSLDYAIEYAEHQLGSDEVCIIGGASIYEQALPLADELNISHMDWSGAADAFFPEITPEWDAVAQLKHKAQPDGSDSVTWVYKKYKRKKKK